MGERENGRGEAEVAEEELSASGERGEARTRRVPGPRTRVAHAQHLLAARCATCTAERGVDPRAELRDGEGVAEHALAATNTRQTILLQGLERETQLCALQAREGIRGGAKRRRLVPIAPLHHVSHQPREHANSIGFNLVFYESKVSRVWRTCGNALEELAATLSDAS